MTEITEESTCWRKLTPGYEFMEIQEVLKAIRRGEPVNKTKYLAALECAVDLIDQNERDRQKLVADHKREMEKAEDECGCDDQCADAEGDLYDAIKEDVSNMVNELGMKFKEGKLVGEDFRVANFMNSLYQYQR